MIHALYVLLGLGLLILGGNWLLKGAVALSLRLDIPKIVIGMTVVSFATSAPELIVSLQAAMDGFPDLALGNVLGSNIANLGLVLGVTISIGYIDVRRSFYFTDWPMLMLASLMFFGFLVVDSQISRLEGGIMVTTLFAFLVYLLRYQKPAVVEEIPIKPANADGILESDELMPLYRTAAFLGLGGLALWGGSELLVSGSVGLAQYFGVSERIIGITVVSIGTSVPELAASIIAMIRKEKAISVGNLIGSNIFNLLAVLGLTALVQPIQLVDERLLTQDIYWMLGISFLMLPLVFLPKGLRLGWRDGVVLLLSYGAFLYWTLG